MQATYLITLFPDESMVQKLICQLHKDIEQGIDIKQIFFYGDAVAIGTLTSYTNKLKRLIALTDQYDIMLAICSAGFQDRQYHLSDIAKQDFSFKGLGQFVAESRSIDLARLVPQITETPKKITDKNTYTLLISITSSYDSSHLKEWLNIALVSASYQMTTAVFITSTLISALQQQTDPAIEQTFNMLGDFNVTLFSDKENTLYGQSITATNRENLQQNSRHHYDFNSISHKK